jgi:hypothetical protein
VSSTPADALPGVDGRASGRTAGRSRRIFARPTAKTLTRTEVREPAFATASGAWRLAAALRHQEQFCSKTSFCAGNPRSAARKKFLLHDENASGTSLSPGDWFHMKDADQYRTYAEECERLARSAQAEHERQILLEMARTWRILAEESESKGAS